MKKLIVLILASILLIGCAVQEDLLVPHQYDYTVVNVTEKWIYVENRYDHHKIRNRVGMTEENIGDWLIEEDIYRTTH